MKNNELDCILLRKKPNCMPHIEYHGTSSCVSPVAFLVSVFGLSESEMIHCIKESQPAQKRLKNFYLKF